MGLGRVINFWVWGCLGRGDVVYFRSDLKKIVGELQGFGVVMRFIYETK